MGPSFGGEAEGGAEEEGPALADWSPKQRVGRDLGRTRGV